MSSQTNPAADRWPPQIKFILGNEAAERFSYYGMKGILALYITNVLMMTKDDATSVIHLFGFANYFMPLVGAWVSDRFWGRYKTILWISLFYCAGHGVMALSDAIPTLQGKALALYVGLGLIAFGSGGIKPCVSAFMGDQFRPDQKHLLQKAYAAFYWSINFGSTASFLLIPFIRKEFGYSWAFGVPGLAMAFATFVFWLGTKRYVMVPPARKTKAAGFLRVFEYSFTNSRLPRLARRVVHLVGAAVAVIVWFKIVRSGPLGVPAKGALLSILVFGEIIVGEIALRLFQVLRLGGTFWDSARGQFTDAEVDAAKSVLPILSIFALVPIFFSLFDQTFSTWVLQGEKMLPYKIGRYTIGPEEMLSANPILVMILLPIMTLGLYPVLGRLATPLRRMSCGMFIAALSFVVVAMMQKRIEAGEQLSVLWQTVPYIIITIAEVLVSTTGLEFAFREAAASMKSTIMGFWNLTIAMGNLFVIVLTKALSATGAGHEGSVTTHRFMIYAGLTFVVAILFSLVAAFYRYRDEGAAQGK